jgi:hypothetical protein
MLWTNLIWSYVLILSCLTLPYHVSELLLCAWKKWYVLGSKVLVASTPSASWCFFGFEFEEICSSCLVKKELFKIC